MEAIGNIILKPFSKRLDLVFLILSIVVAMVGSVLVSMSDSLLYWAYDILQTKVFHREFNLEKWMPTINALISFPIFFGIVFDSLFFIKFSDRSKMILLLTYFLLVIFFLALCSALKSDAFMDSDMASDVLLGKECWLNKTFWPTSWYYSTEIRLLNMQIFSAPVFAFTDNWHIVKTISSVFLSLLLPISTWFVLEQLKIENLWLKSFVCLLVFIPCSFVEWHQVQFGSYYVTLVASTFFYAGFCFALIYSNCSEKKEKAFKIMFYVFAFLCGLSSIRYILQISFPLALIFVYSGVVNLVREKCEFKIRKFFINDKKVFYSSFGFLLSGIGYLVNNLVLSRFYTYANFNSMAFNGFNEIPVMKWFLDILCCFGYRDKVAVFTPAGIINVLVYVFIVFFIICMVKTISKKDWSENHRMYVLFSLVMFVFNAFVFINTDYYSRYMMILCLCLYPCLAMFLCEEKIFSLTRYVLGVSVAMTILTSAFINFSNILGSDGNRDKKEVAKFLEDSGLTFGYGTLFNADVFIYMTNGKVEIANLDKKKINGDTYFLDEFKCDYWLTPKRYYEEGYNGNEKVFLVVSAEEFYNNQEHNTFKVGKMIYDNNGYIVFEYENNDAFKNSF